VEGQKTLRYAGVLGLDTNRLTLLGWELAWKSRPKKAPAIEEPERLRHNLYDFESIGVSAQGVVARQRNVQQLALTRLRIPFCNLDRLVR